MKIISVRENPEYKEKAIRYFQSCWSEVDPALYENSIEYSIGADQPLPQWYLLEKNEEIIGCAGLITNDFISRMDLYPWLCALYIAKNYRGYHYGKLLINRTKEDAKGAGFRFLNLCTSHIGYYEKLGFQYIGQGYHPWGETSRIYQIEL